MPTAMMITAITSPATYSSLPWPKGCSSSAGLAAIRKPIRATTEEPASERLFTASASTAMLPEISPTVIFAANSATLQATPTIPPSSPYAWRTFRLPVFSGSFTNILTRNSVNISSLRLHKNPARFPMGPAPDNGSKDGSRYSTTTATLMPFIFTLTSNASWMFSSGMWWVTSFSIGRPIPAARRRNANAIG